MNVCCEKNTQRHFKNWMIANDAVEDPILLSSILRNIAHYVPFLSEIIDLDFIKVVHSKHFFGASILSFECPQCQLSSTVIVYSSRLLLLTWETQILVLSQISSWEESGNNTAVKYSPEPTQEDVLVFRAILERYTAVRQDTPYRINELVAKLQTSDLTAKGYFQACVALGQIWIVLHELSHELFPFADVKTKQFIETTVENFVTAQSITSEYLSVYKIEHQTDLMATYLSIILHTERLSRLSSCVKVSKSVVLWMVSGSISSIFLAMRIRDRQNNHYGRTHPSCDQRVALIKAFLSHMSRDEPGDNIFSLSDVIETISGHFEIDWHRE